MIGMFLIEKEGEKKMRNRYWQQAVHLFFFLLLFYSSFSSHNDSRHIAWSYYWLCSSMISRSAQNPLECERHQLIIHWHKRANRYSMTEFTIKIDRLTERLRRGTTQLDLIEQRACLAEERLSTLNESVQTLARLIEVSLLILISSDKEKLAWIQMTDNDNNNTQLTNPIIKQFFYRLENYLHRTIIDKDERLAYMKALSLVRKPSIVSSSFF